MEGGNPPTDDAWSIDTTWLESANERAINSLNAAPPFSPTIFRVPPSLRRGNNLHDYKPKLVSIGPYHRSEDLQAMEDFKWRMLYYYLSMVPNGRNNEVLRMMKEDERRARNCYSEVIDMDSDRFMEMLLLDGSFLVQIFITRYAYEEQASVELKSRIAPEIQSLLCGNSWFRILIIRDMLLLENQLPYFIVQRLLDALKTEQWNSFDLRKVALSFFIDGRPQFSNLPDPRRDELVFQLGADHLLDLFHRWILSIPRTEASETRSCCYKWPFGLLCSFVSLMLNRTGDCLCKAACGSGNYNEHPVSVPTITELAEAGVKIEVRKAVNFINISFSMDKGVLKIPAIYVDDHTSFLFANLIAFEQCCRPKEKHITNYALFLDDVINTTEDVELLHQRGIIHRCLGSDENIASLFNELGNGVVWDADESNYLHNVYKDLNAYCQAKWPRFRAKAMHYYFNSPWALMSSVAAALLIVLTTLQTIYTIMGYYKKSGQP